MPLWKKSPSVNSIPGIIKTLAYFDLFQYPLLPEEIGKFLDHPLKKEALAETLFFLKNEGIVFEKDGFFSLGNDPALAGRRRAGNTRAAALLTTANRIGRFLYQFPFVRGVGISGSLSKNFAGKDADIDFFIITAANRLWIARTLMHFFKKLSFLTGRQHWFCMNYYISTDALVIGEKNIFTATEVVTLIPVCGEECFRDFFIANDWVAEFYPNVYPRQNAVSVTGKDSWIKKALENMPGKRLGNALDDRWMKITGKRWLQKEHRQRMNSKGEPMGLKTGKEFARPTPEHFQKKILDLYTQKLDALENQWHISFTGEKNAYFFLKEII